MLNYPAMIRFDIYFGLQFRGDSKVLILRMSMRGAVGALAVYGVC